MIVCSHFERPGGKRVAAMSLQPVAVALGEALGRRVRFAEDCTGLAAQQAIERMADGDVLVLENTRFHPGEEANDPDFAAALAALAEIFVHDAFSAAHRAHASTEGVARLLPAYAGRLMQAELEALELALGSPRRPVMAVVGGAKVSTKLDLLGNLVGRVETLVIGGAMANTFLAASGVAVGRSLQEAEMHATARAILEPRGRRRLRRDAAGRCRGRRRAGAGGGDAHGRDRRGAGGRDDPRPRPGERGRDRARALPKTKTLVWNGPLGAFETPPFDAGTVALAQAVAAATEAGRLRSVAGGGDTVAALRHAGVAEKLSYVSTAGGAFLEWMEGRILPGVAVLGLSVTPK